MNMNIGVIKGDGIGPEIVEEAMKVLDQVAKVYGHTISYTQLLMGGASIDEAGVPLTEATLAAAKASDAVLMGSIGGDAKTSPWYQLEPSRRPEAGLLQLRKGLNLFANLRPAVLYEELKGACPLKEEIADRGFDLMIMRELTGGLYFGKRSTEEIDGVVTAKDEPEINFSLCKPHSIFIPSDFNSSTCCRYSSLMSFTPFIPCGVAGLSSLPASFTPFDSVI